MQGQFPARLMDSATLKGYYSKVSTAELSITLLPLTRRVYHPKKRKPSKRESEEFVKRTTLIYSLPPRMRIMWLEC